MYIRLNGMFGVGPQAAAQIPEDRRRRNVILQLLNPMEMMMVTQFFTWLLSGLARKRVHKCASTMLRMDDRLLRDIGLTKSDVLNCMSSSSHMKDHCLPARRGENLEPPVAAAEAAAQTAASRAAAPPAGGLAA